MTTCLQKLTALGILLAVPFSGLRAAPSVQPSAAGDIREVKAVIDRCMTGKTDPAPVTKINSFLIMDHCAALGNGNLMVTTAGVPEK